MAKVVYVNGASGDDGNSGLSPGLAKASILGARAATAAGDLVLIEPGVFVESDVTWSSASDANVLYMANPASPGNVIIDFENRPGTLACENGACNWRIDTATRFLNLHFRNPNSNNAHSLIGGETSAVFLHCVFYQRDGTANTGRALSGINSQTDVMIAYTCSFYNLGIGIYSLNRDNIRNCYFNSVTTPFSFAAGTGDHNAYPGNTETNGINTSTTDPGFRDAANLDFRLDPTTIPADYQAFVTGGLSGGRIGAFGNGGLYYNRSYTQLRFFSADPTSGSGNPQPSWENEGPGGTGTYTDGTPGDIVEDGTTFSPEIDIGAIPAATGGRFRSPVFDMGASGTPEFVSAVISGFQDLPAGAAFDTNTTLPQKFEYRSSATSFAAGDGTPTWNLIENSDSFSDNNRYIQFRVTFRTDHTNA